MSVAIEKFINTPQTPAQSWDDLEWNHDNKKNAVLNKIHDLVVRKAKLVATITWLWILSVLSSCCWEKSVDDQVSDIIKEKQEKVDNLNDKKKDLEEKLIKVNEELIEAEKELRKAEKLK